MFIRVIRQNVFETNSSSSHSVSFGDFDEKLFTDLPKLDENGNLSISTGEYGWEYEEYNTIEDRLSYAATYMLNYAKHYKKMFEKIIRQYTCVRSIFYKGDDNPFYGLGYIDHNSHDEASDIFISEKTLAAFLFNPNSCFETGNDN